MHQIRMSSVRPKVFSAVCFCLCLAFFTGCSNDAPVSTEAVPRPVKFFTINSGEANDTLDYAGVISPIQEVDLAFEVPGRIIEFPVVEGVWVKKQELLAALDPRDFQAAMDARMAQLNASRADYDRARELYENNTISRRELDVARRNYEVAAADVETARKSLEDTKLRAPFAGIVAKTLADNFQNVGAKQAVMILQDNSLLKIIVNVPESDYTRIPQGASLQELTDEMKPEILVASVPGRVFPAKLYEMATAADPVTRTFEMALAFKPPSDVTILPGMTARTRVKKSEDRAGGSLRIPAGALFADAQGNPNVWLIQEKDMAVKQHPVKTGDLSGGSITILNGLKTGDIIAVSGVHQLREGMKVRRYE